MNEEILADILLSRAGWVLPDGSLRAAPGSFRHFEALIGTPFEPLFRAFEKEILEVEEIIEETMAADEDDHPAWHRFDGLKDEPRERIVLALYKAGFVRLGVHLDPASLRDRRAGDGSWASDPRNNLIDAEGLTESIERHSRLLHRISRKLGMRFVTHEYEVVNWKIDRRRFKEILSPVIRDEIPVVAP